MFRLRVPRIAKVLALVALSLVSACATSQKPNAVVAQFAAAENAPDFKGFMNTAISYDKKEIAESFGATRASGIVYTSNNPKPSESPCKAALGSFQHWCGNTGGTLSSLSEFVKPLPDGIGEVCAHGVDSSVTRVAVFVYDNNESRFCPPGRTDESKKCRCFVLYADSPDFATFSATVETKIEKENAERKEREARRQVDAERRRAEMAETAKREEKEQKIREERGRIEAAARIRALDAWRSRTKVGDSCWVGPYLKGKPPYGTSFFMHGLIVEVRKPLVRVQFDGGTTVKFDVGLTAATKEIWTRIEDVYPESDYTLACSPCNSTWTPGE